MSFGAGHIQDMNNRLKNNRDAKTSAKVKFKDGNWETRYNKESESVTRLEFITLTDEELDGLKKEIREKTIKRNRKQKITLTIISVSIAIILIFIFLKLS